MDTVLAELAFTPSVKAAQRLYGSREKNSRFEWADETRNWLTDSEIGFIGERDSFYQATVSESGWPYIQHRGGPLGFLKVLDNRTIAYADCRGNAQYLSVGNLNANNRISLMLMDYPNRQRLKIWGRASIVDANDEPDLMVKLTFSNYRTRVERGIVIHIDAFDWNCPQHITPRYSKTDVEKMIEPLLEEIRALKLQTDGI